MENPEHLAGLVSEYESYMHMPHHAWINGFRWIPIIQNLKINPYAHHATERRLCWCGGQHADC